MIKFMDGLCATTHFRLILFSLPEMESFQLEFINYLKFRFSDSGLMVDHVFIKDSSTIYSSCYFDIATSNQFWFTINLRVTSQFLGLFSSFCRDLDLDWELEVG